MRRAVLLLALVLLAACSSGGAKPKPSDLNNQPQAGPYQGFGLVPPLPRPSFTLTDTTGKRFSFSQTAGHPTLLYFGYTHCPDICPTTMADIDAAQAAAHVVLAEDGGQTHAADVLLYGADDYAHVKYLQSDNESDQIAHDLPLVSKEASS